MMTQKNIADTVNENEVIQYEGLIRPLIPKTLTQCANVAEQFAAAGMCLTGTERFTDEKKKAMLVVSMMKAMSIGKDPSWALEFIYVINNKPTLYGDGPLALANESGLIEHFTETPPSKDHDNPTAVCTLKRVDRAQVYTSQFSVEQAKRAKLWGKPGPWTQHPDRMLQLRARARLLRDAVPEALGGFQVKEELQDIPIEKKEADKSLLDDVVEDDIIELKKVDSEQRDSKKT